MARRQCVCLVGGVAVDVCRRSSPNGCRLGSRQVFCLGVCCASSFVGLHASGCCASVSSKFMHTRVCVFVSSYSGPQSIYGQGPLLAPIGYEEEKREISRRANLSPRRADYSIAMTLAQSAPNRKLPLPPGGVYFSFGVSSDLSEPWMRQPPSTSICHCWREMTTRRLARRER